MLASAGVHSMATFDQSASISSATMSGSDVMEPWPISAPVERIVMVPSGAMRTHGVTCALASVSACAGETRLAPCWPSARQNVMPVRPASTERREMSFSIMVMASALPRCALDGRDDAVIGAAAAEIAVHVCDDLGAARLRVEPEQFGGLHDLAGLAVAALRHLFGDPRLLQRVRRVGRKALDGDDPLAVHGGRFGLAGAHGLAVHMHRTGAAQAGAAAVFGARQGEMVADDPQKRRRRLGFDRHAFVVQGERDHVTSLDFSLAFPPFPTPAHVADRRPRSRG